MRLTIDTTTDSKEELRRVIRFLQLIVNERDTFRNELRNPSSTATESNNESSAAALGQFLNKIEREPIETREDTDASFKLDFF